MDGAPSLFEDRRELKPVRHRSRWIWWGLCLQIVGVGIPVVVLIEQAKKDGLLGQITLYTVRFVWHEALRSGADLSLIVAGVALFAAGSMLLARPFVRRRTTLLVAVPVAAVVGVLACGVLALMVAVVVAIAAATDGELDPGFLEMLWWGDGRKRRRSEEEQ